MDENWLGECIRSPERPSRQNGTTDGSGAHKKECQQGRQQNAGRQQNLCCKVKFLSASGDSNRPRFRRAAC